ncbi:MAG: multiheme c-type cytochrome [Bacteroidales bacterium]
MRSGGTYAVFAWNVLGMHCLNPTYDKLVILPPYNNIVVQVVKRGELPEVVTSGVTAEYSLRNNTTSYGKRSYGGSWDNSAELFNVALARDIGLKENGLSGDMAVSGNYFMAVGVLVVPVNDNGTRDPYQVALITVRDDADEVVATTEVTVPTADEINCAKCHPCPALRINTGPQMLLFRAIHGSHASKTGITCYDCHPGVMTKCSRSVRHTSADGNCISCHGSMANVAGSIASGRVPRANEPACSDCHTDTEGVSTGTTLYRNAHGHGDMLCSACHGSPHAMYPTNRDADNYQSRQYQGFTSKKKLLEVAGFAMTAPGGMRRSANLPKSMAEQTRRKAQAAMPAILPYRQLVAML